MNNVYLRLIRMLVIIKWIRYTLNTNLDDKKFNFRHLNLSFKPLCTDHSILNR